MSEEYTELFQKFAATPYASLLGIRLVELSRGYAKLSLEVQPQHLNFGKLLHGGVIMSLADQAFACACNTYGKMYVAIEVSNNIFGTAEVGETISAECRVVHIGRTIAVCEMNVYNGSGKLIARATGTSAGIHNRRPTGELIEETAS